MTCGGYLGDEPRVTLGDPAEDEEGRFDPGVTAELEDLPRIALDQRGSRGPGRAVLELGDTEDVEPVLDVEGQRVGDRR
jgi:hypothetical protein